MTMKSIRGWEISAALAVVAGFGVAIFGELTLPARVATHFDLLGKADGFGPKESLLWVAPFIGLFIYGVLSGAQRLPPQYSSYPIPVTDANREALYALGRALLRRLKAITLGLFLWIDISMVIAAQVSSLPMILLAGIFAFIAWIVAVLAASIMRMIALR